MKLKWSLSCIVSTHATVCELLIIRICLNGQEMVLAAAADAKFLFWWNSTVQCNQETVFWFTSQTNYSKHSNAATQRLFEEQHLVVSVSGPIISSVIKTINAKPWHTPGIKKRSIKETAVVVVADKVSRDRLPRAVVRHNLIGYLDPISGIVKVQKHNIKHQGGLSWDVAACRERKETEMEGEIMGLRLF